MAFKEYDVTLVLLVSTRVVFERENESDLDEIRPSDAIENALDQLDTESLGAAGFTVARPIEGEAVEE